MVPPSDSSFRWQDGERLVLFGRGRVAEAGDAVGEGYVLMTTERAVRAAPDLVDGATDVVHVGAGRVDELAAVLRPRVRGEVLLALGGGRVIDTAKALAAADGPRRVAAVPTTLSGAEMTRVHRQAAGAPPGIVGVRPASGATRLRELGVEREGLDACVEAAARRAELEHTPPRADPRELRALYEAAW